MRESAQQINDDNTIIYAAKPVKKYNCNSGYSKSLVNDHFRNLGFYSSYDKCPFSIVADDKIKNEAKNLFDSSSKDEIDEDFCFMKTKSEIIKSQNELISILKNSTNRSTYENDVEEVKIERVKNPFYKNFDIDEQNKNL